MTDADRPWRAERVLDVGRAAGLVAAAAPSLAGRPVHLFAEGWDNAVFAVIGEDHRWLFRCCRRAVAVAGIRREIAVLPRIASLLPLPVPVPIFVGNDGDPDDPWPFFGTPAVEGVELAVAGRGDRRRLAGALGTFLLALHGLDPAVVADLDVPTDPMRRALPTCHHDDTVSVLARVAATGGWSGLDTAVALLDRAAQLGPSPRPVVLVHGDLHLRHVLVDRDGGCAGVIDWGDLCLGDPAIDLAIGYAAFEGTARDAFVTAYSRGGGWAEDVTLRARALALRLTGLLALHAADVDDRPVLAEALAGLDRALR